jgi:hypothetical protein
LKLRRRVRRPAPDDLSSPPALALIIPDDLGEPDVVHGVGHALARTRNALADEARYARALARQEGNDQERRAYMVGRADALTEAIARTDAAMANVFESETLRTASN